MKRFSLLMLMLIGSLVSIQSLAQAELYKCPSCGRYHERTASTTVNQPQISRVVNSTTPVVQTASAVTVVPGTVPTTSMATSAPQRWRFHNAHKWSRRIEPNAQAWAQQEANRLAQRGYRGYLQNGHPGGNNPHASVTGTGTTFPGADLIHTCEGSNGMTLVAEAAAVSNDGRIYGVRSWR